MESFTLQKKIEVRCVIFYKEPPSEQILTSNQKNPNKLHRKGKVVYERMFLGSFLICTHSNQSSPPMKDAGSSKWDVINYEGRRAPPEALRPTAASNGGAEAASVGGWAAVMPLGGARQSHNPQTSFDAT